MSVNGRALPTGTPPTRPVGWQQLLLFVVLAYALSWWPWPLAALSTRPDAAVLLPFGPSVAAVIVLLVHHRQRDLRRMVESLTDIHLGRLWWVLTVPVLVAAVTLAGAVAGGATAPSASELMLAVGAGLATFPVSFIVAGPLGEELGWRGYLLPALLRRSTPPVATALTAAAWVCFHLPLMTTRPTQYGPGWALALASVSTVMTRLHLLSAGSLALAVTFHAAINTTTAVVIRALPEPERPHAWVITGLVWAATAVALELTGIAIAHRRAGP